MNIGNKIIEIRKENNLSQEEFAEKFNVTRQTISNWENSKNYPDLETIIKISNAYNISLDSLLKGDIKFKKSINQKNSNIAIFFSLLLIIILPCVSIFLKEGKFELFIINLSIIMFLFSTLLIIKTLTKRNLKDMLLNLFVG